MYFFYHCPKILCLKVNILALRVESFMHGEYMDMTIFYVLYNGAHFVVVHSRAVRRML